MSLLRRRATTEAEPLPELVVQAAYDAAADLDDLSVWGGSLVHLEMLDESLATLMIYGHRGTEDYVQVDIVIDKGALRLVQQ